VVDALSIKVHESHATSISMYRTEIKDRILEASNADLKYRGLVAKLQQHERPKTKESNTLGIYGLLLYKNKVYVPNVQELKLEILKDMHNMTYDGHPGYQKTMEVVKSHCFWSSLKK
jgi:hypothetical protein